MANIAVGVATLARATWLTKIMVLRFAEFLQLDFPRVGIKGGMGNEETGMRNGNGGMEMSNGNTSLCTLHGAA